MNTTKWILFLIGYLMVSIGVPILAELFLRGVLCWKEPIVGPITAITVVVYCYFLSPKYRVPSIIVGFILCAILAYQIPDMHWYPECHPKAYVQTYLPLAATYLFGFMAIVLAIWRSKLKM